jgi:tRNA A64-2'-O-ribosylphosphate transferase
MTNNKNGHESNHSALVVDAQDLLYLRLCSIYNDSKFIQQLLSWIELRRRSSSRRTLDRSSKPNNSSNPNNHEWPIVANERAGSWYSLPYISKNRTLYCKSTHFKSTDGHIHIYNFSMKRLNLDFMETAAQASRKGQSTIVVDTSKYKILPDSFNATLPIWCCVLNRVAEYYRTTIQQQRPALHNDNGACWWDTSLYVPSNVSTEEYDEMINILSDRVQSVIDNRIILNPEKFVKTLHKPLRCFWIYNNHQDAATASALMEQVYQDMTNAMEDYICILCVNCSDSTVRSDHYIPGAGDDEQSWSIGLTPSLFWDNHEMLLKMGRNRTDTLRTTIQNIVEAAKMKNEEWFRSMDHDDIATNTANSYALSEFYDTLGSTGISIGSRRAGRPPECWNDFDAIINVTTVEYDEMSSGRGVPQNKYYLQLPVDEGKRDRTEFERWLPIALLFVFTHAVRNKNRVLIHCAQGMDRSVGIALACMCMFCLLDTSDHARESLHFHSWCTNENTCMDYKSMRNFIRDHVDKHHDIECEKTYKCSGIPTSLVDAFLESSGKDAFFSYARHCSKCPRKYFATKDTSRLALLHIQQYRKKANPARKTMQKLHRFFMSGGMHAEFGM